MESNPSVYVLYPEQIRTSGRLIVQALGASGGMTAPPPDKFDYVINYGSQTDVKARKGVINTPASLRSNSNKLTSLQKMVKAGVQTPALFLPTQMKEILANLPVVGRKSKHKGGSGFYTCVNKMGVERAINAGCNHFLKLLSIDRELRLHVFNGVVTTVQEKVASTKDAHPIVRSYKNGWRFVIRDRNRDNIPEQALHQAIAAVRACGYVFGAVDIGITHDGKIYIFEVNSAPGLDENSTTLERFVRAARKYMSMTDNPIPVKKKSTGTAKKKAVTGTAAKKPATGTRTMAAGRARR